MADNDWRIYGHGGPPTDGTRCDLIAFVRYDEETSRTPALRFVPNVYFGEDKLLGRVWKLRHNVGCVAEDDCVYWRLSAPPDNSTLPALKVCFDGGTDPYTLDD